MPDLELSARLSLAPEEKRDIPAKERDEMEDDDFAGKNRSFPINKCEDVSAAAASLGRAGEDNFPPERIKANIIRIAKRKGFERCLPESWQSDEKATAKAAELAVKALYDAALKSGAQWGWLGFSHNGYADRLRDIIPSALIERDLAAQEYLISKRAERSQNRRYRGANGEDLVFDERSFNGTHFDDYGALLWSHDTTKVIGRTVFSALVDGQYVSVGAGTFSATSPERFAARKWRMSIGFLYTAGPSEGYPRDYKSVYVYERTMLPPGEEANELTFAVVRAMNLTSDSAVRDALALS